MQQAITLIGHLTQDPSLKVFASGTILTRFRLAASRRVRRMPTSQDDAATIPPNEDANYIDRDQLYIDVECWGNLAENVNASVKKGKPVICVGYLTTQEWQDAGTGNTMSKTILRATYVGFEMRNYVLQFRRNPMPQVETGGADFSKYPPLPEPPQPEAPTDQACKDVSHLPEMPVAADFGADDMAPMGNAKTESREPTGAAPGMRSAGVTAETASTHLVA
ncbi:MAG: single-stranded DNA-binding protein [Corynebacterium sp.]|uniref:single-stranded DNA-binding protein n=1 Tax=Corynebacterium sp. TaxID=1720 RepID=UPI0026DDC1C5|nr:single-stranded DNA-binding protein [Corynebacterium sp.]MDO5099558.1 single-stranded DNA-binding protein [Corynebacterium sp.]